MTLNFRKAKLKGRSFKGNNLTGADFSNTDIRGCNFTDTVLTGANFSQAKAGIHPYSLAGLILLSIILAFCSGAAIGFISVCPGLILSLLSPEESISWVSSMLILISAMVGIILLSMLLFRGIEVNLILILLIFVVFAGLVSVEFDFERGADIIMANFAISILFYVPLFGSLSQSIFLSITNEKKAVGLFTFFALVGAIRGGVEGFKGALLSTSEKGVITSQLEIPSYIMAAIFVFFLLFISIYIGIQAIAGDKKYSLVKALATNICTSLGTNFQGADLTDADFTEAILPDTDFRKATLKRTCWFHVKKLNLARFENTYLEDPSIRKLVISKNGEKQKYNGKNLRELNLKDANLVDASFIEADLSESTLANADLTGAILAQAKLYGTNLSHATLTKACIEGWAISTDLIYDNIICEEIFMRLTTKRNENPCRKPDDWNETFQQGDFEDFIFPHIDRLKYYTKAHEDPRQLGKELQMEIIDLYHYNEFNSPASLIALHKIAQENIEANLEFFSLRAFEEQKVHLKIAVLGEGNCEKLNKDYWQHYRKINQFSNQEIQQEIELIAKEDNQFSRLIAIFAPSQGDSIIISVGRDLSGVLNIGGNISGTVTNVRN